MDAEQRRELVLKYRDMADDELAELALSRGQLTEFARPVFDDEVRKRGDFMLELIEEKRREAVTARFDAMNDDDLVSYLHSEPVLTRLESEVAIEQMLLRELDPTTLPVLQPMLVEMSAETEQ
jgi:hypothetical protein